MTHADAIRFIENTQGKIFSLVFTKRTDGSERHMVCRLGVYAPLAYGEHKGPAYDAASKGLLTVWDMEKRSYKNIPLDAITKIKVKGQWQTIKE